MSLESLYRLSILVDMIDRVSGPASRITGAVGETAGAFQRYSAGMASIARDGVVLIGTGLQIASAAAAPVKATFATQDALAELSSLGIENLQALEAASTDFSNTWAGTTKPEFLTAAYDIKSGIASLLDAGVAEYSRLAGITAKATKSTIEEMTSLFATGYGIYKGFYGDLTDIEFAEVFSAGISQSVKQFKTTGSGMAQAISALGASATSAKVPLEEQLSILGMLQATMSGGEAGTKYTAFLQTAAKAGKDLGLNFTGANGQLKSMPEILGQLQGKFGDVLTAADKLELQKAFGTQEAVKLIELLYTKTDDLQGNIITLYDTMGRGIGVAEEMANKINAPPGQSWELLQQKLQTTLETVGNAMLPRFIELQQYLDTTANKVINFTNKHPRLVSNIVSVVGAGGLLLTAMGALKLVIGSLGTAITLAGNLWKGFKLVLDGARYGMFLVQYGLYSLKAALAPLGTALLAAAGHVKTLVLGMLSWVKQGIMSAVSALPGLITSVWSFTAALLANPITWIVVGVVALIAALVLLWQNWDSVTAFLQNTWQAVCDGIASAIAWLREKLDAIPDSFKFIFAAIMPFIGIPLLIIDKWQVLQAFFANFPENIKLAFQNLKQWFADFFGGLGAAFRQSGAQILTTLTEGIMSKINAPGDAVRGAFQRIRNMMPFSDAKEGPLSELTLSGRRVFETFDAGMQQSAQLPQKTAAKAFGQIDGDPAAIPGASAAATTGQPVRQTIIQQLILKVNLDELDELKKLKALIGELEDGINGNDPDPNYAL